jgi:glycogen operon protein
MHAPRLTPAALALATLAACGGPSRGTSTPSSAGGDDGGPAASIAPGPTADAGGDASSPELDAASDTGPFPLGVTWGASALHFRLRADAATRVELDVYAAAKGQDEVARYVLARDAKGVWGADVAHADLAALGITGAVFYGYRAWGANWPYDPTWTKGSAAGFVAEYDPSGARFDPNKLLLDPYGREISHDPAGPGQPSSSVFTTGASRAVDDGQAAPKSIALPPDSTDYGGHVTRALKDDVIYEVHVRGLTKNDASLGAAAGTFAGAAARADALAALGVTAVELLPIHETQNDQNDAAQSSANYWGYSTLAFFAPDRRYAQDASPGGPTRELKAMVKAFHARGIKVLLDVVFNHTAEGGGGKTAARLLSFRGLDAAAYYELQSDGVTPVDDTGTGGNFNAASPVVRDLVIDALHYWHDAMGVDGFRFDLAAVLGNSCASGCYAFAPGDPAGILARAVSELPARPAAGGDGVDLIAEPWGVGNGTYQLGAFPAGWSEWNGTFRDTIRQAQNELGATPIAPSALAAKIGGSPDLFDAKTRAPAASIDYVDCHDGFTLNDVYAFDAPNNAQAYPLGPSSGGDATNHSWDQGGDAAKQRQAARTGMALVALSAGVPMFQGGDEFLRTQQGNNNAYNLDDSAMWLDAAGPQANADFVAWTSALLAFRAAHAALRPAAFRDGKDHDGNGLADLAWLDTTGNAASGAYLGNASNHFLAWRIDGEEAGDTARSVYVAWNGWTSDLAATIPAPGGGKGWFVAGDSASGAFAAPGTEAPLGASTMTVKARSIAVLVER